MILASTLLKQIPWIQHGFGTREEPESQEGMASLKQIHSSISLSASRPGCMGEGDALITSSPDLPVSIRTADCFPILLADMEHRAVAAIHAGWRGTDARIVVNTLLHMRAEFGTQPEKVAAAIGPGIGPCCYEVGEDVGQRFGLPGPGRLDLAAQNLRQLLDAGVPRAQIEHLEACTFCDAARFYSWRRDHGQAGRMISYISISG
ncbi:MAG TPA: peptidoglycan editing factor PgeF [Bryobacteraceae bacterium]|nr:peptidoglycan editing factor PgeF [Bryobacteraceae bacterium]